MCTVCGCSDTVTADGRAISHEEAHRLGLAHHHHVHDHDHGHNHGHNHGHSHFHPHEHSHEHHHHPHPHVANIDLHHYGQGAAGVSVPGMSQARLIEVETSILAKNDHLAEGNRRVLRALGALALNLGKRSFPCTFLY